MARKRMIESIEKGESSEKPDEVEGHQQTEGWPFWIRNELLRYWYIVGCMFLDSIIFLQVYLTPDRPIVLAMVLLIGLIVLETFIYKKVWPLNKRLDEGED